MSYHDLTISGILTKFAKHNPTTAFIYLVTIVTVPIQAVLLPHLYGKVVNAIQLKQSLVRPFVYVLCVICFIHFAYLIAEINEIYYFYPGIQGQLRKDILTFILKSHEVNYDEQYTASLVAKMVKVPNVIYGLVDQYKFVLIPQTIVALVVVGYFLYHDVPLGLGLALAMFIIVIMVNATPHICKEPAAHRDKIMNHIYDQIDDMLKNMMSVFNFNTFAHEDGKLDHLHQKYKSESWATLKCIITTKSVLIPVIVLTYAFFMWRCYNLTKNKKITTGAFVSMFMIMLGLMGSLSSYMNQTKELVLRKGVVDTFLRDQGYIENKQEIVSSSSIQNQQNPPPQQQQAPVIELRNVTFAYTKNSAPALLDVSFAIPRGQKVLIHGKIGCGKSTLLKLIMKYKSSPETSQRIFLNGVPYSALRAQDIRTKIGYIPQQSILFDMTIYDNIIYGVPNPPTQEQVTAKIKELGITFPNGLNTPVGKGGSKLSGGQRQIVWMLRIYYYNPPILLLDEPTASMDPFTKQIVHGLIEELMFADKTRTVIMVAHDVQNKELFDRVITLQNGRITSK